MLSLSKVFNAQTVLKSIIRETSVVRAHGIAPDCKLYLKPENRLIMMNNGKIIFDVSGEEKRKLTVADLLEKFKVSAGEELNNDRILLS